MADDNGETKRNDNQFVRWQTSQGIASGVVGC